MIVYYCDRCKIKSRGLVGDPRIRRVTMEPLSRKMDLCGECRTALQPTLDRFLEMRPGASRDARNDVEEALWHLRTETPYKKRRPDLAWFFLTRALRGWTSA